MPRVAFLTLEDRADYVIDDALAVPAFAARGIAVEEVPWTRLRDRAREFDAVIVRTTWDYQKDLPGFLEVLHGIEAGGIPLENSLELIRWNATKTYMRDLEHKGVRIVPTLWGKGLSAAELAALPQRLGSDQFVVKPVVGANADDTYWMKESSSDDVRAELIARFKERAWMAQPFVRSVVTDGEYSLFYFDGELSHAIVKRPKSGDFRVQEEHGGLIVAIEADAALRAAADRVIAAIGAAPLQARVDLVVLDDGAYALMELEAIEPSLYFRTDAGSADRFARAVERRLARRRDA